MNKHFTSLIIVIALSVTFGSFANAQLLVQRVSQGGTATSTTPVVGDLLMSWATGSYGPSALIAGTNVTISTSTYRQITISSTGGSGTVSTSTVPTVGNLSYWTSAGYPSLLGTVATTTLTASSPLSLDNPVVKVGGSNSILSLSTAGTWSGNAGTATALAANGANCSAGNYPLGVNASGAVEDCTAVGGGGAFAWTPTTYDGVGVNATSTSLWLKATSPFSLIATSTFATYASSTQLTVSGAVDLDNFTSAILLTGAGGDVAEYAGTSCTNQSISALSALGVATCSSINNDWWSGTDLSVTNGGTGISTFTSSQLLYGNGTAALSSVATSSLAVGASITSSGTLGAQVGGTVSSLSLNMANANTWTALQTFGNASTTQIGSTGSAYFATAGGNVGIGTVIPTAKLAINGLVAIGADDANSNQLLISQADDSLYQLFFENLTYGNGYGIYVSNTGTLSFDGAESGESFVFTSTGNVGIGTTIPSYLLDIAGTMRIGSTGTLLLSTSTSPTLGAQGAISFDTTSNNIIAASSTTGHFVVASATTTLYAFAVASTSPDFISGGIIELPSHFLSQVVTGVICDADAGTSVVVNLSDGTNDTNTTTCTTTETQFPITSNNTFTAYEDIRLEVGTITGTVDRLSLRFIGYRISD